MGFSEVVRAGDVDSDDGDSDWDVPVLQLSEELDESLLGLESAAAGGAGGDGTRDDLLRGVAVLGDGGARDALLRSDMVCAAPDPARGRWRGDLPRLLVRTTMLTLPLPVIDSLIGTEMLAAF